MLFCAQLSANFLKISFFQRRVQILVFPNFSVLSLTLEKSPFLGLLKHYKIWVSANFCVFLVEREKNQQKKIDNWNFWFCFLVQKSPFRDAHLSFKKCFAETPILIVFWGARLFGQVVKKGKFWTPTKNWLIIAKLVFCFGSFVFFCLFFCFVLFCCFFCSFFPFFASHWKNLPPPQKKRTFFVYFWVSPFVSP